jgi:hypothetical protein
MLACIFSKEFSNYNLKLLLNESQLKGSGFHAEDNQILSPSIKYR